MFDGLELLFAASDTTDPRERLDLIHRDRSILDAVTRKLNRRGRGISRRALGQRAW